MSDTTAAVRDSHTVPDPVSWRTVVWPVLAAGMSWCRYRGNQAGISGREPTYITRQLYSKVKIPQSGTDGWGKTGLQWWGPTTRSLLPVLLLSLYGVTCISSQSASTLLLILCIEMKPGHSLFQLSGMVIPWSSCQKSTFSVPAVRNDCFPSSWTAPCYITG